ncbi:uncharacterized protein LOC134291129 [Aedes albopictus]|uniref:Uncharacterized protein n=1 Tax=Aedes albopictus TaxID=7160 RepID=A0ABM1XQT8_AEDAL|nr:hypothetical protein RP20_CCG027823 [Aedes albopictus]
MKTIFAVAVLATVLVAANCAPYQIAYLVPVEVPLNRVARAAQFGLSGSAANAGAQSFNSGFGGFGGLSGSSANAASQSFTQGGGFGFPGFSGSAANAGAQSFSGGAGGFPGFGGFSGSAANAGAQSFSG